MQILPPTKTGISLVVVEPELVNLASQFGIAHKLLTCAKLMHDDVTGISIVSGDIYNSLVDESIVSIASIEHLKR